MEIARSQYEQSNLDSATQFVHIIFANPKLFLNLKYKSLPTKRWKNQAIIMTLLCAYEINCHPVMTAKSTVNMKDVAECINKGED